MAIFTMFVALFVGLAALSLYMAPVVLVIAFFVQVYKYQSYAKYRATPKRCPSCGSENVKIESQLTSLEKQIMGNKAYQAGFHNKKHLICNECGHRIPYIDQYDINAEKDGAKTGMKVFGVLAVICAFGLWSYMSGAGA